MQSWEQLWAPSAHWLMAEGKKGGREVHWCMSMHACPFDITHACVLTTASHSITVQSKPRSTAALEWTIWVGAGLCTATIVVVALIDICWRKFLLYASFLSKEKNDYVNIPLQSIPSAASVNPFLQLHVKEPWVLVQLWVQPPLLVLHSLMSGGRNVSIKTYHYEY